MIYRKEIDGLRAIAVLPVMFFHAGFSFMHQGFLGVDIFFVISGFLITSIIIDDLQNGTFSFKKFYLRRVKRIFPVLFTVLFISTIFAWFIMLPDELEIYGQSLIASMLFYANFFFYFILGGYFSADAEFQPLLHIWSLAVEEQFYFVFPFLLLGLYRFGRKAMLLVVSLIFLASFVFCIIYGREHQFFTFYMLPTRFWELAAGAILAISTLDKTPFSHKTLNYLAWFGLLLLIYSLAPIQIESFSLGLGALPVIIGTVILLAFARSETTVAKILSWKPLVAIGLISYSAYLWHQPIFVFARLYYTQFNQTFYLALIILTLILAALSWRFIEKPFRKVQTRPWKVFTVSTISAAMLCLVGAALPQLYTISSSRMKNSDLNAFTISQEETQCKRGPNTLLQCNFGSNPEVLLIGDSYARHLIQALLASKSMQPFNVSGLSACPPLFDLSDITQAPYQKDLCLKYQQDIKSIILKNTNIRYVIISSSIVYYSNGIEMLTKNGKIKSTPLLLEQRFREIIGWLSEHNVKVVIVSPPPRLSVDPNICIKSVIRANKAPDSQEMNKCQINEKDIVDHTNGVNALLKKISDIAPIVYLDKLMCKNGECPVLYNNEPIYSDKTHFSSYGAYEVGKRYDLFGKIIAAAIKFNYPKP